jgi:hypothetical protein
MIDPSGSIVREADVHFREGILHIADSSGTGVPNSGFTQRDLQEPRAVAKHSMSLPVQSGLSSENLGVAAVSIRIRGEEGINTAAMIS